MFSPTGILHFQLFRRHGGQQVRHAGQSRGPPVYHQQVPHGAGGRHGHGSGAEACAPCRGSFVQGGGRVWYSRGDDADKADRYGGGGEEREGSGDSEGRRRPNRKNRLTPEL